MNHIAKLIDVSPLAVCYQPLLSNAAVKDVPMCFQCCLCTLLGISSNLSLSISPELVVHSKQEAHASTSTSSSAFGLCVSHLILFQLCLLVQKARLKYHMWSPSGCSLLPHSLCLSLCLLSYGRSGSVSFFYSFFFFSFSLFIGDHRSIVILIVPWK